MSDVEHDEEDDTGVVDDFGQKYTARLVRGTVYFLGSIRFDKGCSVVIFEHHKDHLEEHAVDSVGDTDGEVMVKDKFEFAPFAGPEAVGTVVKGMANPADYSTDDVEKTARLRKFRDTEAKRLKQGEDATNTAKPFDKVTARQRVRVTSQVEEGPPPRVDRFRTRRAPVLAD